MRVPSSYEDVHPDSQSKISLLPPGNSGRQTELVGRPSPSSPHKDGASWAGPGCAVPLLCLRPLLLWVHLSGSALCGWLPDRGWIGAMLAWLSGESIFPGDTLQGHSALRGALSGSQHRKLFSSSGFRVQDRWRPPVDGGRCGANRIQLSLVPDTGGDVLKNSLQPHLPRSPLQNDCPAKRSRKVVQLEPWGQAPAISVDEPAKQREIGYPNRGCVCQTLINGIKLQSFFLPTGQTETLGKTPCI